MTERGVPSTRIILLLALASWAGFFIVRATGPVDLMSRDQVKVAGYTLDIIENDAWLWQTDHAGNFASKPPLTQWLSAWFTRATGQYHRLTLTFPSWLACLISVLVICGWTAREFGPAAALWAPLLLLANPMGIRAVLLARSDPLFLCTLLILALCIWRCWVDGARSWPITLAGTAAVMTKGPLALLVAPLGLLATLGDNKADRQPIPIRAITITLLLSLLVPALWLLAADQASDGQATQKLLKQELVGHAIGDRVAANQQSWTHHLLPLPWFLSRLAPVGLIALIAIVRFWRGPAGHSREDRAVRFLIVWLVGGLLLLCLATHHRFIHLLIVLPPATMLAAREVSRWIRIPSRGPMWAGIALSGVLPLTAVYLDMIDISSERIVRSREVEEFAYSVQEEVGPGARLEFFGAPAATQAQLGKHRPSLPEDQIATTLDSDEAIYVIVDQEDHFRQLASKQGTTFFDVPIRRPFDGEHLALYASKGASGTQRIADSHKPDYLQLTLLALLTCSLVFISARFVAGSVISFQAKNSN
ncbi:MAG: glycosyltransferase family 39 protein [Planctomycetota bacterium]|nr:glycosyltransferase family 39 protein [Planctomycetota bacterium]